MIETGTRREVAVESASVTVTTSLCGLRYALRGLALQPELAQPVSFVLDAAGAAAARAEILRALPVPECEKLAHEALDAALCALRSPETRPAGSAPATLPGGIAETVLETLASRGLVGSRTEQGCAVRGGNLPSNARIAIEPFPCAAEAPSAAPRSAPVLQIASEARLRLEDPASLHAMARYALELNQRLRVARVSVDGIAADAVRVVWQAVLPAAIPVARGLVPAVEAVAVARNASARVLSTLTTPAATRAYLALRFPGDPALRGHTVDPDRTNQQQKRKEMP